MTSYIYGWCFARKHLLDELCLRLVFCPKNMKCTVIQTKTSTLVQQRGPRDSLLHCTSHHLGKRTQQPIEQTKSLRDHWIWSLKGFFKVNKELFAVKAKSLSDHWIWRLKRITAAGAHEIFRFYNCKPQSMQSEPFTVLHGSAHFFSTFNILCQNFRIKWLELLLAPLYTFTTQFPEKEFHSRA